MAGANRMTEIVWSVTLSFSTFTHSVVKTALAIDLSILVVT